MRIKSLFIALTLPIVAATAAVAGPATPAHAVTTCAAASFRPTYAGDIRPDGYVQCTSAIYKFTTVVALEKWVGGSWQPYATNNSGWNCYNTYICGPGSPRPSGPYSPGIYRTVTWGNVQSTPSAGVFPVTPRYSTSITL